MVLNLCAIHLHYVYNEDLSKFNIQNIKYVHQSNPRLNKIK